MGCIYKKIKPDYSGCDKVEIKTISHSDDGPYTSGTIKIETVNGLKISGSDSSFPSRVYATRILRPGDEVYIGRSNDSFMNHIEVEVNGRKTGLLIPSFDD